ncbi:MAG: class I SAM-dependent methyltransferase [Candidatus Sumerlaeota bacterium]|nr:class I SAM-dependent methyltransferase [Candidatus Sumerlaeota bacterium]
MNIEEYEKMYVLEDTYWWFQGKKYIVFSLLDHHGALQPRSPSPGAPPPIAVDIGCGTGLTLAFLRGRARPLGLDLSPLSMMYCRKRGIHDLGRCEATALPLRDESVDLALALDMIEHISDDVKAYSEIARILRPGGQAILTVPAHPFLWSEHDEALHHFRRYTRGRLRALLESQPLEITRLTYAITFTFAPIVLFRVLTRLVCRRKQGPKTHVILLPRWINRALIGLLKIEARLLRRMDLPFGVSLVAMVKKKLP